MKSILIISSMMVLYYGLVTYFVKLLSDKKFKDIEGDIESINKELEKSE